MCFAVLIHFDGNILVKNNVYFISFISIVYNLQDPEPYHVV